MYVSFTDIYTVLILTDIYDNLIRNNFVQNLEMHLAFEVKRK